MMPPDFFRWVDETAAKCGAVGLTKPQEAAAVTWLRKTAHALHMLDAFLEGELAANELRAAIAATGLPVRTLTTRLRDVGTRRALDREALAWCLLTALEAKAGPVALVWVPDLVRALNQRFPAIEWSHQWLFREMRAGKIELRPEGGMNRLSANDRALCPLDADSVPLSHVLVVREQKDAGGGHWLRDLDDAQFAAAVVELAHTTPSARYDEHHAYIAALWDERARAGDSSLSLDDFKARLVNTNKARLLTLSRADFVEGMDLGLVRRSEIRYHSATWHFVRL